MATKQKKQKPFKPRPKLSVEEQELELRMERAQKTPFRITELEEPHTPFINYEVIGDSKVPYSVEIRSFKDKINSCSCPDYKVNTFSTCKHIEGVLFRLQNKGKRRFKALAEEGSPRAEIYRCAQTHEVRIRWPRQEGSSVDLHHLLDPYFSSGDALLAEPMTGI